MKKPDAERCFDDRLLFEDGLGGETKKFRPAVSGLPGYLKVLFMSKKSQLTSSTTTAQPTVHSGHPDASENFVFQWWKSFFYMHTPHQTNPALLPGLELIRGLACLQVLLSHILIVLMLHSQTVVSPAWWKLSFLNWGYQSVMIFFVLSGYVIALSQKRKQQGFTDFMRSRFRRLEPLYLVALLLSFGMENMLYPPASYGDLGAHLLYLQGSSLGQVFSANTPLWSLSYEFFFYFTFALLIGRRQKQLQLMWFVLGLGAIGLSLAGISAPGLAGYFQNILANSPVWLLGVFLAGRTRCVGASMPQKLVLFGMLPLATQAFSILGPFNSPAHSFFMGLLVAPLLFAATQTDSTPAKSRPLVWLPLLALYATLVWSFLVCTRNLHIRVETIFAISAPWLFMTLAPLYHFFFSGSPFSNQRVVAASLWLGKMSYAIYIIHFPLLLLIGAVKMNPLLLIGLDVFLVISLAWFLTFHVEPALVAGFDRIWPRARKPVANLDTRRPLGAEK